MVYRPADPKVWEEALPIGNGRLGGMVFGGLDAEHIQLNEDSVWYGGPRDRNNPDALSHLQRVRELATVSGRSYELDGDLRLLHEH